ncbi:MAG: PIN domain-containing protein [Planctomycetaceae bacterium]|nr:PIN domain-containing protein [Planctomycetaceae bacterium]
MANSPPAFRAVLDSNVLVAAQRSADPLSPNRELIERWKANEFTLLFSRDTLLEYAEKLLVLCANREDAIAFIALISALGEAVEIEFFHLPHYPADSDDIAFLLCAWNGFATHLASYDRDLLNLSAACERHFKICPPPELLAALRGVAASEASQP